jgi:hypothetical protein
MCRITGYSAEELTGRRFTEITHPDDVAADVTAIERALAGDDSIYRGEKRYLRPDDSVVWVSIHTSLVRDTAGEPLYAISQVETSAFARQPRSSSRAARPTTRSPAWRTAMCCASGSRRRWTASATTAGRAPCCSATSTASRT